MKHWILIGIFTLLAVLVAQVIGPAQIALAQTGGPQLILTVNSLLDDSEPAGDAGDGVCDVFPLFTGDNCTLRAAIDELNAYGASTGAAHRIEFDFSGATPYVIAPSTALPGITVPVVIDGTTVAGAACPTGVNDAATLTMVLDGVYVGTAANGLTFETGSGGSTVRGMVIGNFDDAGIGLAIGVNAVTIQCNFLGVDWMGSGAMPNGYGISVSSGDAGTVGGTAYAGRNVISGNTTFGVYLAGSNPDNWVVKGNFIGTDATGLSAIPNGTGLYISGNNAQVGGPTAQERNVVSGNNGSGISISAWSSSGTVVNNYIGVDALGTGPLGNGNDGILLSASNTGSSAIDNTIGVAGQENIIAYNGGSGILSVPSSDNAFFPLNNVFRNNSIFDNGELGIDLSLTSGGDGVTPNDGAPDSDSGPNGLISFPVLSDVKTDGVDVFFTLDYAGKTGFHEYDLYLNDSCDNSGYGEGQDLVYSSSFLTDGSGLANVSNSFPQTGAAGKFLVATASDGVDGTSEFSACAQVA